MLRAILAPNMMGFSRAIGPLLEVPNTQLHVVENNLQRFLETGPFVVSVLGDPAHPEGQKVQASADAAVGATTWLLGKLLPALKAADTIYSFGLEGSRAVYYCLFCLQAITDVLTVSCALSTSRQVDAAAEEADMCLYKLSGGKGAQQQQQQQQQQKACAQLHTSQGPITFTTTCTADKVAAGMLKGSALVAAGVAKAAAATSAAIQGYVARQVSQPKLDGQPVKVSPALRTSLPVVGKVASSAAYATGGLASLVGQASFGSALAIAKMLPSSLRSKQAGAAGEVSSEERSALRTVGAAGLLSFMQVYDALEQAAQQVAVTSAGASQQYIQYKYGDEAGQLAAQGVAVAANMMDVALKTNRLGARAFIGTTAQKAAGMYLKSSAAV